MIHYLINQLHKAHWIGCMHNITLENINSSSYISGETVHRGKLNTHKRPPSNLICWNRFFTRSECVYADYSAETDAACAHIICHTHLPASTVVVCNQKHQFDIIIVRLLPIWNGTCTPMYLLYWSYLYCVRAALICSKCSLSLPCSISLSTVAHACSLSLCVFSLPLCTVSPLM